MYAVAIIMRTIKFPKRSSYKAINRGKKIEKIWDATIAVRHLTRDEIHTIMLLTGQEYNK